jgi:hypothetical protein
MGRLDEDVQMSFLRLIHKNSCQSLHSQQLVLVSELNLAHVLLETVVDGDGNLVEFEGICVNVFECDFLLVLDGIPESADVLGIRNFDSEDVICIVASHETVELKGMRIRSC